MAEHHNIENMAEPLVQAAAAQTMAALFIPTDDPVRLLWNDRLSEYLSRQALVKAEGGFGFFAQENVDFGCAKAGIEERFGRAYRSHPEGQSEFQALMDKINLAEQQHVENFLRPYWAASCALAMTPAPDLAAAITKVDIMNRDDVANDITFDVDAMAIVQADFHAAHR